MGNVIKQTNRTMLMEVINPEKLDFLTLVGDVRGMESLSDDKIKEINDHLLVRSFDEFLENSRRLCIAITMPTASRLSTSLKSRSRCRRRC